MSLKSFLVNLVVIPYMIVMFIGMITFGALFSFVCWMWDE